jgi:hypothetical protein
MYYEKDFRNRFLDSVRIGISLLSFLDVIKLLNILFVYQDVAILRFLLTRTLRKNSCSDGR